ncbi:MAG: hypothetical protein JNK05_03860 [Myxococcales bacterium]|nr:hypothetical protein [Myxococcales bacterium]
MTRLYRELFDVLYRHWFQNEVNSVVRRFAQARTNPAAKHAAEMKPPLIGKLGEKAVADALTQRGFLVVRSPGSRSPGDVWALRDTHCFVQIAILQVKAAARGRDPAVLNDDAVEELRRFGTFAWQCFIDDIQEQFGEKPLLLSVGYAGVSLFDSSAPTIIASHQLGGFIERTHRLPGFRIRLALSHAHDLEDVASDQVAS